jgi:UDP-N-acetylglucosamine/UDP-N-acetylgalactosamine diphosphorylase
MEIDSAVQQRLINANQIHLLAYWSELNNEQRKILLHDISEVDFERVQQAYNAIKHELLTEANGHMKDKIQEVIDDIMEPIPDHMAGSINEASKEQLENYRQQGLKAVSEGSVSVLLLAGGQGTRLGVDYPKGMFNVDLPSKKSLYQIQAERIRRVEQLAYEQYHTETCSIPWFIMTSEHTQEQTEKYFRSHNYFGLKRENIILFEQHTLPALDFQGKILLEEKHRLTKAADGNGGLYRALKTRGVLNEMNKRHIKYIHVYGVDNILVRLADPIFIGFCLEKNADCAAKVVKKTVPTEAVGVICKVGDRFQVVEYSEIAEQTAHRKKSDDNDELVFNAGNICNHFFTLNFLQNVCHKHENELRYHIAKKKIPAIDENGIHISKPSQINGIKLEKFVFDVFPFSKTFAVWEVRRDDEFSPLKNGSGTKDTPATCRRDLMIQHIRWLEQAGAHLPSDITQHVGKIGKTCEISPLVSYAGENLEFVKGQSLDLPIVLENHTDKKIITE